MPDIAGCELGAHVLAGFKEGGLAVKGMLGGGELGAHALAGFEDLDLAVVVMSGRELGAYVLALFKETDLAVTSKKSTGERHYDDARVRFSVGARFSWQET